MQNSEWLKIKEIFHATLELSALEREPFLADQEDSVRAEILELLAAHERSDDFIAEPASVKLGFSGHSLIGQKIGNYKLLEVLGSGGMGTVFLAEKKGLEKKFAVKLIKRGMDTDEVLRRFDLERKILAKLEHPNITPLRDGGMTEDGLPFLVMEYVEGIPINGFCDSHGLGVSERLKVFRKVCDAVNFAHQNLVIHRDLKPLNILVTKEGIPKLLDFGIAKLLDPDSDKNTLTTLQHRRFTPEYASPEQISGESITTASDVYSLGVVLYELLSGQRPFQTESRNNFEISKLILNDDPVKPSAAISNITERDKERNTETGRYGDTAKKDKTSASPGILFPASQIKGDLDNIILKALRKEPERRYNSAQEFSEDIGRYLSGMPVTASPDTNVYRLSKFIQRHKIAVAAGIFMFILLSATGTYAVWQGVIAERERQKAEKRLTEIREVARSLMNETNESLGKIPGNIPMRKSLTEKSVALLDSLADDEKDDALLVELARAYTKLAEFQTLHFREYDKANSNLKRADTFYQKILQKDPDNAKVRLGLYETQQRQIESLRYSEQREELFAKADEIIENLKELIRIEPLEPSHRGELAAAYGANAKLDLEFGRKEKANLKFRQGLEIIEEAINLRKSIEDNSKQNPEIARSIFIKAWLLDSLGDKKEAIKYYQSAAELAARFHQNDPTIIRNIRRIFGSYESIGDLYASENNYKDALKYYSKAVEWVKNESKNKKRPTADSFFIEKCRYTIKAAKMFEKTRDRSDTFEYFSKGENICLQNLKENPGQTEMLLSQLKSFYEIADFYHQAGKTQESVSLLNLLAEKMEKVLKDNEWDFGNAFSLAETYEKSGDYSQGETARRYYEKSHNIWAKYDKDYTLLPNEVSKMKAVRSKLEDFKN